MKKFVLRFSIIIAIVFVLAIVFDYIITSGLKKTDIRKYAVWNDIYKGGIDADLLVIGASNAWCGFDTYIMDSVLNLNSYNLGIDGHPIDFQIIRYDTYRRFNVKPKIVLINTIYGATFGTSAHAKYEREQFFPYIHDKELIDQVAETKSIDLFDRYLPLIRYFGYREEFENGIMAYFGKEDFKDGGMYKGYRGNDYGWDRSSLSRDTVYYLSIDQELVMMFESFSKQLIEDGIELVYVKSPIYYPLRSKFMNLEQTDSIYSSISKKYNIPVLDYYYSKISMDSMNFYNPGHLNKKGAELFTIQLCHDLDSLGVLRN